jgi:hypothetical protein
MLLVTVKTVAQTTIEVIADQPDKLEAVFNDNPVFSEEQMVIFGSNIDIIGGEGPFDYLWINNGEPAGTGPTLEVNPYLESDNYSLFITDANNCTTLIAMSWDGDIPSAIFGETPGSGISVYPVPVSSQLTIDPGDWQGLLRVTIFSNDGEIVIDKQIAGLSVIDIDLPSGIYMVRIADIVTGVNEVKKIVVL